MTNLGSGIWLYRRRTRLAILKLTVPATIIRSDCRGVARKAPAPKRSRSKRDAPTAIISIAQHASPNVIGHNELRRPQLIMKSRLVTIRPSSKRFSIHDIVWVLQCSLDYTTTDAGITSTAGILHAATRCRRASACRLLSFTSASTGVIEGCQRER